MPYGGSMNRVGTPKLIESADFMPRQPALFQERSPARSDLDDASPLYVFFHDESALIRVFPDRQSGTRRPPRIHYLFVASIALNQPLKKIQNQAFWRSIAHGHLHPYFTIADQDRVSCVLGIQERKRNSITCCGVL